jgi:hypothetical protein
VAAARFQKMLFAPSGKGATPSCCELTRQNSRFVVGVASLFPASKNQQQQICQWLLAADADVRLWKSEKEYSQGGLIWIFRSS